jgi:hypothetical protein
MPAPARAKPDRTALKATPGMEGVTDAEIDAALASVNADTIFDAERATWTTQVWDRKSPINGVPAQHFLDRDDVDEVGTDDIYLLIKDGAVVGFQPHEAGTPGLTRIPKGKGVVKAKAHTDEIAADATAAEVVRQVREKLTKK